MYFSQNLHVLEDLVAALYVFQPLSLENWPYHRVSLSTLLCIGRRKMRLTHSKMNAHRVLLKGVPPIIPINSKFLTIAICSVPRIVVQSVKRFPKKKQEISPDRVNIP